MSSGPALTQSPISAHPDLSPAHKRAVEGALMWAWGQLVAAGSQLLQNGNEEAITAELQSTLNRFAAGVREAPGLRNFETVTRGEKQVTAANSLEKEPDLTFRPFARRYPAVTNTTDWGLFVEAKIIEAGHGTRTVKGYIEQGVNRFVAGEYAKRMPSGMLIAYLRDKQLPMQALAALNPTQEKGDDVRACSSHHPRVACVAITLRHLWLAV